MCGPSEQWGIHWPAARRVRSALSAECTIRCGAFFFRSREPLGVLEDVAKYRQTDRQTDRLTRNYYHATSRMAIIVQSHSFSFKSVSFSLPYSNTTVLSFNMDLIITSVSLINRLFVPVCRPAYLHSLLSNHISGSTATLRSASRPLLHVSRTRTVYGSRAFSVAALTLWNSLQLTLLTLHH